MKYQCRFPSASLEKAFEKTLLKISDKKICARILQIIEQLSGNPRPFETKSFKKIKPPVGLENYSADFRIRIGSYRVLYSADDSRKVVWILALRKRDERTYRSIVY